MLVNVLSRSTIKLKSPRFEESSKIKNKPTKRFQLLQLINHQMQSRK